MNAPAPRKRTLGKLNPACGRAELVDVFVTVVFPAKPRVGVGVAVVPGALVGVGVAVVPGAKLGVGVAVAVGAGLVVGVGVFVGLEPTPVGVGVAVAPGALVGVGVLTATNDPPPVPPPVVVLEVSRVIFSSQIELDALGLLLGAVGATAPSWDLW